LSFRGIGGYLVNKFVKQTKINSWLPDLMGDNQNSSSSPRTDADGHGKRGSLPADPPVPGSLAIGGGAGEPRARSHPVDRALPDRQAVDTILRYAASNERELTRATRLLLLLQSSRRATELNSAKRSQELV
jgi:hypothetical protein